MSNRRRRGHYRLNKKMIVPGCLLTVLAFLLLGQTSLFSKEPVVSESIETMGRVEITEDFLTPNAYSRPQIELKQVKGIVIHYVGNANSTAKENRDYFESLKENHERKASSHYIIGLEGEIIQCIPLTEIAYASNERNKDTISIETCHPNEDGSYNQETYDSLVKLTGELCVTYGLSSDDVIRHYDVTGKLCPLYFVENEDKWDEFRQDVEDYIIEKKE
ncbi:MAG: peptidoglycan recognition family protein [Lachnospiraceae bacterium]|nr:peptidoglycan recognition family protein [Lachnospiraceae bacterium]